MEMNQDLRQVNDDMDNESNKSDKSDDDKMNVFGFNDDLGPLVDDRIIIQNPTENAKYNLVERTKYLLNFENKEAEAEFLFKISKQEAKKSSYLLLVLLVLNKLIILGDILEQGAFVVTIQFILMFPIFILEVSLIYKLNNPSKDSINMWTFILLLYGIVVMCVLISLEFKYFGNWSRAGFNELLFELTLSIFFFMRNIFLRHFIIAYVAYIIIAICIGFYYAEFVWQYQTI